MRWHFEPTGEVSLRLDSSTDAIDAQLDLAESGFGKLAALRHSARMARTPPVYARPSVPLGSHPPNWPERG